MPFVSGYGVEIAMLVAISTAGVPDGCPVTRTVLMNGCLPELVEHGRIGSPAYRLSVPRWMIPRGLVTVSGRRRSKIS